MEVFRRESIIEKVVFAVLMMEVSATLICNGDFENYPTSIRASTCKY